MAKKLNTIASSSLVFFIAPFLSGFNHLWIFIFQTGRKVVILTENKPGTKRIRS